MVVPQPVGGITVEEWSWGSWAGHLSPGSRSGREEIREPPGGESRSQSRKGKPCSEEVERFDEAAPGACGGGGQQGGRRQVGRTECPRV